MRCLPAHLHRSLLRCLAIIKHHSNGIAKADNQYGSVARKRRRKARRRLKHGGDYRGEISAAWRKQQRSARKDSAEKQTGAASGAARRLAAAAGQAAKMVAAYIAGASSLDIIEESWRRSGGGSDDASAAQQHALSITAISGCWLKQNAAACNENVWREAATRHLRLISQRQKRHGGSGMAALVAGGEYRATPYQQTGANKTLSAKRRRRRRSALQPASRAWASAGGRRPQCRSRRKIRLKRQETHRGSNGGRRKCGVTIAHRATSARHRHAFAQRASRAASRARRHHGGSNGEPHGAHGACG
jgi:hypothetical protein